MISRNQRISAFIKLGQYIADVLHEEEIEEWIADASSKNNWFTPQNVKTSLLAISGEYLNEKSLTEWANQYPEPAQVKKVGVVMAGNIPAVGFHDALCVLVSGHILLAKPASDDQILIRYLLKKLVEIEPGFEDYIQFVERLNDADAYVATGSDNTARYFHYYFSKKPNIIRKNRTSVAVLNGNESEDELTALGLDIFQYYGLGCRNVSKLFVPAGYDFTKFYESIESYSSLGLHHHKYFNNYEYNKSILLVNRVQHFDNGFLILTEGKALVSAISVVHYEYYDSIEDVKSVLQEESEKIQCVVGSRKLGIEGTITFGLTQKPSISDYADSVDTMAFLAGL
jgi:hypothetical protein